LQRDGLSEVATSEILKIEAVVDVRNRCSELNPNVFFADPGNMAFDESAVEKSQGKFLIRVGNGPIENTDLGAGFGKIDEIANPRRIAKLYGNVLMRRVAKFGTPVVAEICCGNEIPA
jgi:hypothetical protein